MKKQFKKNQYYLWGAITPMPPLLLLSDNPLRFFLLFVAIHPLIWIAFIKLREKQ